MRIGSGRKRRLGRQEVEEPRWREDSWAPEPYCRSFHLESLGHDAPRWHGQAILDHCSRPTTEGSREGSELGVTNRLSNRHYACWWVVRKMVWKIGSMGAMGSLLVERYNNLTPTASQNLVVQISSAEVSIQSSEIHCN